MNDSGFLKISITAVVIIFYCMLFLGKIARANESYLCSIPYWYWLSSSPFSMPNPLLLIYLDSMCHDTYSLYFNTLGYSYLLGYYTYTPFLSQINTELYNLLGIPAYPYLGSQYHTTYPYATLSSAIIPYSRFDYPVYIYGSPNFYFNWVLLQ